MRELFFQRIIACAAALVVGLVSGCDRPPKARAAAPVPNVQIVHLEPGEITRHITVPGNLRADQEAMLYAKVSGYLKTIAVDSGDWVQANDVLAEIEAPELLAEVAKYRAEVEMAELELHRVRDAIKKAPDLVIPMTVDAARGRYEIAKVNLARIKTLLRYTQITAPFDGVVTKRWVDVGAFIPAATSSSVTRKAAVVTLMDVDRVRIDVAIAEPEVLLIKTGLPVEVTVAELPDRPFHGTITRFAFALDEATKQMMAEIEIPNGDHVLRPGMYVSCEIALETKRDAQLLPAEALISEKNRSVVFALRDDKAVRVPVKIGFDDGISVEILGGLQPDEAVIVAGKGSLRDGQPVHARSEK